MRKQSQVDLSQLMEVVVRVTVGTGVRKSSGKKTFGNSIEKQKNLDVSALDFSSLLEKSEGEFHMFYSQALSIQ
jgi:hypothetical protein